MSWLTVIAIACIVIIVLALAAGAIYLDRLGPRREKHVRTYVFSSNLFEKLRTKHPHLTVKDCQLVARALRQFFLAHLVSCL
jgi:hypothetical protein